jgi:hypothetical protein
MNAAAKVAALEPVVGDNNIAVTVDAVGSAIDVRKYDGSGKFVLVVNQTGGTTPTLDVKLTESATLGGTYTDVAGGAYTQFTTVDGVQAIDVDLAQSKGFVKFSYDSGGTSPAYTVTSLLIAEKKYRK